MSRHAKPAALSMWTPDSASAAQVLFEFDPEWPVVVRMAVAYPGGRSIVWTIPRALLAEAYLCSQAIGDLIEIGRYVGDLLVINLESRAGIGQVQVSASLIEAWLNQTYRAVSDTAETAWILDALDDELADIEAGAAGEP